MAKLWEPNKAYDASKPQSWDNMPYKRLYKNLTPEKLAELLQDAKRLRWEALDLSVTAISALPDSVGNLKNLRMLDLSDTAIRALPSSIGNLTSLQWLSLKGGLFFPLSGEPVFSRKVPISALPDSIGNLTNLQYLNLNGTKISALPDSIGNLKKLRKLGLRECHLKEIPYSVVALGLPFVIDNNTSFQLFWTGIH